MKLVVLLAIVLCASPAFADGKSDATAAYSEGQRRYVAEDYAGAAEQFLLAYKHDPDPAYLFNIAQAYRYGKRCTDAAKYYRKLLVEVPKAPNVAAVTRYLDEMDECAKREKKVEVPPPAIAIKPPPEPIVTQPDPRPQRDEPRSNRRRNIAIGVGAAGVVAGAVATALVYKYARDHRANVDECKERFPPPQRCVWTNDEEDDENRIDRNGKISSVAAVAGFAVGGLAVAGAVVLHLRGGKERKLAIAPAVDGMTRGVIVRLPF